MRYYIRAKEFIRSLFWKLRNGAGGKIRSFKTGGRQWQWKESISRFGKGFDRQKIFQHKSFQAIKGFDRQKIFQYKSFQALKNFDYEKFFNQVFSPQSYRTIHLSFLITIFVVFTYTMGKMAAYILLPQKGPAPYKNGVQFDQNFLSKDGGEEWEQILTTDLFRTESKKDHVVKSKGDDKVKLNLVCNDSDKKSPLPLKLINAVVLQDREKSVASVQQNNKKKILYLREGDRLENISVKNISRFKMVFANRQSGECEYIARDNIKEDHFWRTMKPQILSPAKGRKLIADKKNENVIKMGNTYQIKKELKEDILNNINTVLTQARAIEIKKPDGSLCFKMVDIAPGSPYSLLDIQNNDVICNINGKKIDNLNSLFALFGKMRDIQNFEMVINRDGQEIPMEYNFE